MACCSCSTRSSSPGAAAALVPGQRFLGTTLNLKPILEVCDGKVEGIDKVRTWSKASDRLLEVFEERIGGRTPLRIAAIYGGAKPEAEALLDAFANISGSVRSAKRSSHRSDRSSASTRARLCWPGFYG